MVFTQGVPYGRFRVNLTLGLLGLWSGREFRVNPTHGVPYDRFRVNLTLGIRGLWSGQKFSVNPTHDVPYGVVSR